MTDAAAPFVALEGPEGAGKSLLLSALAEDLLTRGVPHLITREPGGTPTGEALREHIWKRPDLSIDGITELLLLSAARHAHMREVIRPALERGEVVITDRFELSTRVYQGFGRGVDLGVISSVTSIAVENRFPDLYVILDVDPQVGKQRQSAAGLTPDRIEREDLEFMLRVREGYRTVAAEEEGAVLVDASNSAASVHRDVFSLLRKRFPHFWG